MDAIWCGGRDGLFIVVFYEVALFVQRDSDQASGGTNDCRTKGIV